MAHWLNDAYRDAPLLVPAIVPMPCRFGCEDSIGLFFMDEGCACYPDHIQALCAQHATTAEPLGSFIMIARWNVSSSVV